MLSAPIVVTPPEGDVIDPAKMKLFLRIDGDDLDGEIADYVTGVAAEIERMTSIRLQEQVVQIQADNFDDLRHLNVGPVAEVVSLSYRDRSGAEIAVADGAYELFGTDLDRGIRPAPGLSWPVPAAGSVRVTMKVGYGESLPPSLSIALKEAVRARFDGTSFDLFAATVNDRIWL
ncbi:MAG: hypothetical protein U9R77_14065 [Pseudomonadota bacterium]|nr:hypothetical protein [Pseudomonadota bacterium]